MAHNFGNIGTQFRKYWHTISEILAHNFGNIGTQFRKYWHTILEIKNPVEKKSFWWKVSGIKDFFLAFFSLYTFFRTYIPETLLAAPLLFSGKVWNSGLYFQWHFVIGLFYQRFYFQVFLQDMFFLRLSLQILKESNLSQRQKKRDYYFKNRIMRYIYIYIHI